MWAWSCSPFLKLRDSVMDKHIIREAIPLFSFLFCFDKIQAFLAEKQARGSDFSFNLTQNCNKTLLNIVAVMWKSLGKNNYDIKHAFSYDFLGLKKNWQTLNLYQICQIKQSKLRQLESQWDRPQDVCNTDYIWNQLPEWIRLKLLTPLSWRLLIGTLLA